MRFDIFMAVVFAALAVRTYKPRTRRHRLREADNSYEREQPARYQPVYRAPPPVEPQEFTEEDQEALTRRMTADDAETLTLFRALNRARRESDEEDEPEEITDLRNASIRRGWRPTSETASPTLTGTVVQEVPDDLQETSEPSCEWKAEDVDWAEPDLLRDGVDITIRKLALKYFSDVPALEGSQA